MKWTSDPEESIIGRTEWAPKNVAHPTWPTTEQSGTETAAVTLMQPIPVEQGSPSLAIDLVTHDAFQGRAFSNGNNRFTNGDCPR